MAYGVGGQGRGNFKAKNNFKTNINKSNVSAPTNRQREEARENRDRLAAQASRHQRQLEKQRTDELKRVTAEQEAAERLRRATELRRQQYMQGGSDSVAYIPNSLRTVQGYKKGGSVGYTKRWSSARRKSKT
jgi:hypothetical protein